MTNVCISFLFPILSGGSGGMTGFHHAMGPNPMRPPSQGHMSGIIDLTDENLPESSLKKLEDFSNRCVKKHFFISL